MCARDFVYMRSDPFPYTCGGSSSISACTMDEATLLEPDLLEPDLLELPSDDEVKEPSGEHVRIKGLVAGES